MSPAILSQVACATFNGLCDAVCEFYGPQIWLWENSIAQRPTLVVTHLRLIDSIRSLVGPNSRGG